MNPLTQVKNTQKATKSEILLGLSESASWHARFKHSAYIFAGGLDYDLTEGDMLAVFAQYGEVVDIHLVRDKSTGKSRGFCFLAYEDQRSTVLAVDNLSGARVAGRIIRVEHVDNYKKKKAEMEGEDPDKVSDDDRPPPRQELREPAGGGPQAKGRDEEPRGGPVGGSMHEILAEGARIRQQQLAAKERAAAAAQGQDGEGKKRAKKEKKEKKPKKEKKEKKEKHKKQKRDASSSSSSDAEDERVRDPGAAGLLGPPKTQGREGSFSPPKPPSTSGREGSFGPPRPPGQEGSFGLPKPPSTSGREAAFGPPRPPRSPPRTSRFDDEKVGTSGRGREVASSRPFHDRDQERKMEKHGVKDRFQHDRSYYDEQRRDGRDRGRDREGDRGRDRESDRGRERESDRGRDQESDRGRERESDRGRDRESDRGRDRESHRRGEEREDRGREREQSRERGRY